MPKRGICSRGGASKADSSSGDPVVGDPSTPVRCLLLLPHKFHLVIYSGLLVRLKRHHGVPFYCLQGGAP